LDKPLPDAYAAAPSTTPRAGIPDRDRGRWRRLPCCRGRCGAMRTARSGFAIRRGSRR